MKKIINCFAGFCLALGTLGITVNGDSAPTNSHWFSGNTIIITVTQVK